MGCLWERRKKGEEERMRSSLVRERDVRETGDKKGREERLVDISKT